MHTVRVILSSAALLLPHAVSGQQALAQQGEAGFGGAGSFYLSKTVSGPSGEAKTGFGHGFSGGGWIGHNMYRFLGGEIRYLFEKNDLKLSSGGTKITFGGQSHAVHYDVLIYGAPAGADVRPFVAVGGGVKNYRGTGAENPFQPLSEFAILTKTTEWLGMVTAGGGVKFKVGSKVNIRVEFRDYMTPFPKNVIAPVRGSKIGGWIHNFVPMFGVGFTF